MTWLTKIAQLPQSLIATLLCSMLLMGWVGVTMAQPAKAMAQDPLVEKRLLAIASELRCLVCQNESLAASNADLALDLKREIRMLIHNNQSDQQIHDFLIQRYGDFILYKPPFKPLTWLLWIGPGLLGLVGLTLLWRHTRRSQNSINTPSDTAPRLSEHDVANANRLLGIDDAAQEHPAPCVKELP